MVGADHVYRMDFSQMIEAHIASGAGVTVAAIRQPISLADQFGVIEVDSDDPTRIGRFLEAEGRRRPARLPDEILASMGNYVFDADVLIDAVLRDGENADSDHDMGGDIVPDFVSRGDAAVYDLNRNEVPGSTERDRYYWRDVGTIDSFYDAHRDLISALPIFNLYNTDWPIFSQQLNSPPAKFVRDGHGNLGTTIDSIVSLGSLLRRARRAQRARAVEHARLRLEGHRLGRVREGAHRAERDGEPRDPRQGRRHRRGRVGRRRPRGRSGSRLHGDAVGHHRRRQGRAGRPVGDPQEAAP